jgi:hypothetical protein
MHNSIESNTYVQLSRLGLSVSEREQAIGSLRLGEAIADGLLWAINTLRTTSPDSQRASNYKHGVAA